MGVDVRSIKPDEGEPLSRMLFTAFGETATDEKIRDELEWAETDRLLGAEEDGRLVGAAGAYTFDMTLPGRHDAARRRRDVGRRAADAPPPRRPHAMMDFQLDDIADRGEAVAILTASEAPIYGRFGYGLATRFWKVQIDTTRRAGPAGASRRPAAGCA